MVVPSVIVCGPGAEGAHHAACEMVASVSAVTTNHSQPPSSKVFSGSSNSWCPVLTKWLATEMRWPYCFERKIERFASPSISSAKIIESSCDQRRQYDAGRALK